MGRVVVQVVQVVVVVLGVVVRLLQVRGADATADMAVVHVHQVWLAVLVWVVVEDGGEVR